MKKFEFKTQPQATTFNGFAFYNVYKEAEFLRSNENIETILSKGYQLRKSLKEVPPGTTVAVAGMYLKDNIPLLVKKTGPGVVVEDYEFTNNRLTGLVAAYALMNRHRFPTLTASEPEALGLTWDNSKLENCRTYLSAVTGTEHFYQQFLIWPLVCGLRKLQLKKITPEPVIKMARMKNNKGERYGSLFMQNLRCVAALWKTLPGTSTNDLKIIMQSVPPELKSLLVK